MKVIRHIPNLLTLLNLFCGLVALHLLYNGHLNGAVWLIALALVFDFSDGFAARLLHAKSAIGRELDSLADIVSFGVVPGVAMFQMIQLGQNVWEISSPAYLPYVAFLIPLFSALRLAKFNVDTRQTVNFIGLPTPANAILIMSLLPQISRSGLSPLFPLNDYLFYFILHPLTLVSASVMLSLLLVLPVRLFSLKFSGFAWKPNRHRYIFLMTAVVFVSLFFFTGVFFVILSYFVISLLSPFAFKTDTQNEIQR